MSPDHKKLVEEQLKKNEEHIKKSESLLIEIESFYNDSVQYNNILMNLYEKLNDSHGMLHQGEYADIYTKDFKRPTGPVINQSMVLSDEYDYLNETQKTDFLKDFPNLQEYQNRTNYFFNSIKPLVEDMFSENSIIIRFEGLEQQFIDLKKISEQSWSYPKEAVVKDAFRNREYLQPLMFHGIPRVYPFHIQTLITYSPKFNTVLMLKNKLQKVRTTLKTINAQLPFAELGEKTPLFQNIVSGIDQSTSIGQGASIGSNNAIGDSSSVGSE